MYVQHGVKFILHVFYRDSLSDCTIVAQNEHPGQLRASQRSYRQLKLLLSLLEASEEH